ncbi:hypothetical protein BN2475_90155 [Paraburkholderia ribeironis]|uniref:Uncharacterized protein n=1 Tax=Paraburkholderia ribeironis TaxID=1247936 RepID=A0A1N7RNJ6_9BURK|nr:hypothetical protein BN2475_90155 [Paraburkholderia ribeironis]
MLPARALMRAVRAAFFRHPVLALCQSAAPEPIGAVNMPPDQTPAERAGRWFAGVAPFMV